MRTVIVGAGPVGLYCGISLARAGHDVVVVDRDPGPPVTGDWRRRGVMQFQHPHFFRMQVRQALEQLPDVWRAVQDAGGRPAVIDGAPPEFAGLRCRRSVLERVLWEAAQRQPGLRLLTGHADELLTSAGNVTGVLVDGLAIEAEAVLAAIGRGSRFADEVRAPGEEQDCGFSYVSRMYRALPGTQAPEGGPAGSLYDGYLAIMFPQDNGTLSALVVRPTTDDRFDALRETEVFQQAAMTIPQLSPWIDPAGFEPITPAMVGGRLINAYRGQRDASGLIPVSGLYFLGDAVCTTNPSAGRGMALGLLQAQALLAVLADETRAPREKAAAFDDWCTIHVRPWYDDHVTWDAGLLRRFAGEDIDPEGPLTSDVVCDAGAADPSMMPAVGPYLGMVTTPDTLLPLHEQVRAMLRSGWRPALSEGPSAADLSGVLQAV